MDARKSIAWSKIQSSIRDSKYIGRTFDTAPVTPHLPDVRGLHVVLISSSVNLVWKLGVAWVRVFFLVIKKFNVSNKISEWPFLVIYTKMCSLSILVYTQICLFLQSHQFGNFSNVIFLYIMQYRPIGLIIFREHPTTPLRLPNPKIWGRDTPTPQDWRPCIQVQEIYIHITVEVCPYWLQYR